MESNFENTLLEWKAKAEALRVQLNLGSKEAADAFDQKKAEIGNWARGMKENLKSESSEQAQILSGKLEELRLQAALAKAEGKDAFADQEKQFQRTFQSVKQELGAIAQSTSAEAKSIGAKASSQFENWETQLDLYRVQLNLAGKEAGDEWANRKEQMNERLAILESKIATAKEQGSETWDNMKNDLASGWSNLKSHFQK